MKKLLNYLFIIVIAITLISFSCKQKQTQVTEQTKDSVQTVTIDTIAKDTTVISLVQSKAAHIQEIVKYIPPVVVDSIKPESAPFVAVEEMPKFPGGNIALLKYIAEYTNYPEVAKENNIQGKVIVKFCVTSKGGISQISVIKGVSPELDAEAIKVVKILPKFKPGKQGGKPVNVWYTVPITFTLK